MNTIKFEAIPNESLLLDIAMQASARHLNLITNGKRSVLCSIVPPGWKVMPIMQKVAA
jgi:hypothetical protein